MIEMPQDQTPTSVASALDPVNLANWSDSDLTTYDMLLQERAGLAKQKGQPSGIAMEKETKKSVPCPPASPTTRKSQGAEADSPHGTPPVSRKDESAVSNTATPGPDIIELFVQEKMKYGLLENRVSLIEKQVLLEQQHYEGLQGDLDNAQLALKKEIEIHEHTRSALHAKVQDCNDIASEANLFADERDDLRIINQEMYEIVGLGPKVGGAKLRKLKKEAVESDELRGENRKLKTELILKEALKKEVVELREVKAEAERLKREVAAMGKLKFENAQLKKKLTTTFTNNGQSSIDGPNSGPWKTSIASSPNVSKNKKKSSAMSQPAGAVGDDDHGAEEKFAGILTAPQGPEQSLVTSESKVQQATDALRIEQITCAKWKQTSLEHSQESIRLRKHLEKARQTLTTSQTRSTDIEKQLTRCICTAGDSVDRANSATRITDGNRQAFEICAIRLLRKIKVNNRKTLMTIEGLTARPGETWGIVTATESAVRMGMLQIEKDIGKVLKVRSGEVQMGELVDDLPAFGPTKN